MACMKRSASTAVAIGISTAVLASVVVAQSLSIYDIQYTTNPTGDSNYNGSVIDCTGGICVGKFEGNRPRLILQDPNYPDGWGGIQTKDWIYPYDMFNDVRIGDWVELTNMLVEEHVGTTFLQRQSAYNPGYNIVSQGNPLPPWLEVTVAQIPAPVYDPNNPNGPGWYVENHDAELYESMLLEVRCVTETAKDWGAKVDIYSLEDADENVCWATDYMNEDVGPWDYHPLTFETGKHFCAIRGVFEQYTRLEEQWDYYQLVTLWGGDVGLCGDLNCDGSVNSLDVDPFVLALTDEEGYHSAHPECNYHVADVNCDGGINSLDVDPFVDLLAKQPN